MSQKKVEDVLLSSKLLNIKKNIFSRNKILNYNLYFLVPQVKYKKSDGTLYVMTERVLFILENKDDIAVSHSFFDIKS